MNTNSNAVSKTEMAPETEKLLDNWSVSGSDRAKMFLTLKQLSKITHVCPCCTNQIQIVTVTGVNDDGTVLGFRHSRAGTSNQPIPAKEMYREGMDEQLADELETESHMLFRLGSGIFFGTKKVLKTLCQRAGSGMGDFAVRDEVNVRFHRDAGYVAYMNAVPAECQVLFRQIGNAKKVYAVFAERYRIIPQYDLVKVLLSDFEKEMGAADVVSWKIDNFSTEIYIEFPEKAQDFAAVYKLKDAVVPGIRIFLSDTGESSFIINGSIRIKKAIAYIPSAAYARAHTKKASVENIAEAVGQVIFGEYTKVPDRLMELLMVDVKTPSLILPKVSSYCGIKKEFGAKFENALLKDLEDSLDPSISYSAYDIAMLFMDACAEREEDKKSDYITKLRSCSVKAVFYKYAG